jgi:hypothetical protein
MLQIKKNIQIGKKFPKWRNFAQSGHTDLLRIVWQSRLQAAETSVERQASDRLQCPLVLKKGQTKVG